MCPEDSAHISNGATFFPEKWGKKARQFSSLISEPYKQWSYLRHTDPKAVSGRGYGGHFRWEHKLPGGICERRAAAKCRMGRRARIRWRAGHTEYTGSLGGGRRRISLPRPRMNSLCHGPPKSESSSTPLMPGIQQATATHGGPYDCKE